MKASKYKIPAQKVEEFLKEGLTIREMSDRLGIPYQTVYNYVKKKRDNPEYEPKVAKSIKGGKTGEKADKARKRKKCRTCCYRGESGKNGCDYIWITGEMRGCSVEECSRYVRGRRLKSPGGC